LFTRDLAATADGREIYFTVMLGEFAWSRIFVTREVNGIWSEARVASFCSNTHRDLEPFVSPGGRFVYFVSDRPDPASGRETTNFDIWRAEREGAEWSEPRRLAWPIGSPGEEFFPSLTRDGVLYFTRRDEGSDEDVILRAFPRGRGFSLPERLPAEINTGTARYNAWVAPDESLLLVPVQGRPESLGGTDYYVSRRDGGGSWSPARPLGPEVNGPAHHEYSAALGPDGRQLFFMSQRAPSAATLFGAERTRAGLFRAHLTPGLDNPAVYWIDASALGPATPAAAERVAPNAEPSATGEPGQGVLPRARTEVTTTLGKPPASPTLFFPGLVSTGLPERDLALSPDGRSLYFGVLAGSYATILGTSFDSRRWSEPEVTSFSSDPRHFDAEPALSPDGRTLFFLSNRGLPGEKPASGWERQNIWSVPRGINGTFGEPRRLPACVNDGQANFFPSVEAGGALVFTRQDPKTGRSSIWRASRLEGECEAAKLPGGVNATEAWNAAVSPDGSRLVFCSAKRTGTLGPADYWVAFRRSDGSWSEGRNLGPKVNGPGWRAGGASFSPDGRWLFFSSTRLRPDLAAKGGPLLLSRLLEVHEQAGNGLSDIYAVDARILDALAPEPSR
jgi:Tol biopolymer transport system component